MNDYEVDVTFEDGTTTTFHDVVARTRRHAEITVLNSFPANIANPAKSAKAWVA